MHADSHIRRIFVVDCYRKVRSTLHHGVTNAPWEVLMCASQSMHGKVNRGVDVCSSMCSFGWNAANQKVPQCPEKLGALAAISSMHDAGILDMLHFASTFVSLST